MRTHRLSRLALLTQGAALVGLGVSHVACGKDTAPPVEELHINAPPRYTAPPNAPLSVPAGQPLASASAAPTTSAAGSGAGLPPRPPMNAPPFKLPPAPKP